MKPTTETHRLFEIARVALFEADISEVKTYLGTLHSEGVVDIRQHFTDHPESVVECYQRIKINHVNPALLGLYKAKSLEHLLANWRIIYGEETTTITRETIASLAEGRTTVEMEVANSTVEGDSLYVRLAWALTPGYEDTWGHVTIIATDITERKRAEEARGKTTHHVFTLMEYFPDPLSRVDREGRHLYVNPALTKHFGMTQEQFLGKSIPEMGITGLDEITNGFEYVLTHKRPLSREIHWENPIFENDTEVRQFPELDENGEVVSILTITRDITEQKRSEQKHENSRRLLQRVIDSVPVRIFWKDRDLRYLGANKLFAQDAGVQSAAELIGKTDFDLVWAQQAELYRADDRSVIETNSSKLNIEEPQTTPSGEVIWLRTSKVPLHDAMGQGFGILGVYDDITERKEAEHKIHQQNLQLVKSNRELAVARRQADESSKLKSQFLATMSHELRTPLNAIIGYSDIVLAGMAGELLKDQHDFHQRILANAEHLLSLINDILDLAKIEAGRMDVNQSPFNIKAWLDEIVMQVDGLAKGKGLRFEAVIDQRLPKVLVGDAGRIKQVVINLLSNAFKFTNEGHVKLDLRQNSKNSWTINVIDTGIGISPTAQEVIFDEFRQVDNSSTRKHGGTGLGLAIVRRFVLAMGGNIKVRSELGVGSTFTVFLPLIEPSSETQRLDADTFDNGVH